MRFSFFAVLASAVSAASLNALVDNNLYEFDMYEAEDYDLGFAEAWETKKVDKEEAKAASDQAIHAADNE